MPLRILEQVRQTDWHALAIYRCSSWSVNVHRRSDTGFPGARISAQIYLLGAGDHKLEVRKSRNTSI